MRNYSFIAVLYMLIAILYSSEFRSRFIDLCLFLNVRRCIYA